MLNNPIEFRADLSELFHKFCLERHSLLNRFTFIFPDCLRPSTTETKTARSWLDSAKVCLKQLSDIFIEMHDALSTTPTSFRFSPVATQTLASLKDDFIKEINVPIQHGNVPPKPKMIDVLQHVADSLHVFNHVTESLIQSQRPSAPPREYSLDTLHKATLSLEYTDMQKEIVMEVRIFLFMC